MLDFDVDICIRDDYLRILQEGDQDGPILIDCLPPYSLVESGEIVLSDGAVVFLRGRLSFDPDSARQVSDFVLESQVHTQDETAPERG